MGADMKIGILGCAGRMGRMLIAQVLKTDGAELSGGVDREDSPYLGEDLAALVGSPDCGIVASADAAAMFEASDAVIDFTLPQATIGNAGLAAKTGTALVIGTTGLGSGEQNAVDEAAKATAVVQAANFSVGVNLLLGLGEQVASILQNDYDIEIVEMHHRHKVDAPSGTALALGKAVAKGRGVDLEQVSERVRDGHTGARTAGDIGFATLRGGDVVGEHTIIFATDGERIELTHKASSRAVFAKGAVRAAMWTKDKNPGMYDLSDVIGLVRS